ncbi:hypothetical protein PCL_02944 [Purpureocillium lilacinum]|uniref:Uncharacterized protein n=1 Tax=Purpureocillium lilacinum TaxID=33203 RepID=A0A2U3DZA4_PURLI|nr:hypothetical protein PCL_02944 [Purpureocillium lilacinum]
MQANEERRHAGSRFLPAVTHAENGRSDQGVVVATSLTRPTFIIRARRLVLLSSAQGASRRGSPMPWMSWQLADAPDGRGMNVRAPLAAPRQASEDSEKRGPVCPPSWYSTCGQAKRQMRHEQGVRAWTSCHRGAVEPQPSQPPSAVSSHASGSGSRASAGTWRWWPYELIDDVDLRMCRRARPSLRQSRQGKRWTPVRWVSRIGVDDTRRQNDRSSAVVWLPAFAFAFAFVRAYWYRVMSRSSTAPQSITVCNGRLAADGSGDASRRCGLDSGPPVAQACLCLPSFSPPFESATLGGMIRQLKCRETTQSGRRAETQRAKRCSVWAASPAVDAAATVAELTLASAIFLVSTRWHCSPGTRLNGRV